MIIKKFVFSPFAENTYVCHDPDTLEALVIDPGCYSADEEKLLKDYITQNNLKLKYLLNTHCHIDHIFGNKFVKETFNPLFVAPEKDIFLLDLMVEQAVGYGMKMNPSPKPDKTFEELDELNIGKHYAKFIFTPGHTPGEYCIYFENDKVLFSGDVLFRASIGRTDLWGGDYDTLLDSIENKLYTLPDDVTVYPGHESQTTIGYEKINNPFISV